MRAIETRTEESDRRRLAELPKSSLSANRLGISLGLTGVLFYAGCVLTMATVPRPQAVTFFNSLVHGVNVDPILRESVPTGEVILAGFYNWGIGRNSSL